MKLAPKLDNEVERLLALKEYDILDTLTEKEYDDLANIAGHICDVPISMITFMDNETQFIKAVSGVNLTHAPRDVSFCGHALLDANKCMVISNTLEDDRFKDNPYVAGDLAVKFYAGVPILNPDGLPIGTFCLFDMKSKELSSEQIESLKALTRQVEKLLELRKTVATLAEANKKVELQNKSLKEFSYMISHDVKAPIRNMKQFSEMIKEEYGSNLPQDGLEILRLLSNCADDATNLINGMISYTKSTFVEQRDIEDVNLRVFVDKIISDLNPSKKPSLHFSIGNNKLTVQKIPVYQIFQNLINNGIKYNDKEEVILKFEVMESDSDYIFNITDNGIGIPKENIDSIFNLFYMVNPENAIKNNSSGVGLSIVKSLVEQLGGDIQVESELGLGTKFTFMIKKIKK